MKFLDIDSPLMQALSKLADLMWLNLLTLLLCVPSITVGPALTAMHYVALKIVRNEECYIARSFFQSFRENFKQGTLIWLLFLALGLVLGGDLFILSSAEGKYGVVLNAAVTIVGILLLFDFLYVFPVLARFRNTIRGTLKNALLISIMQFPKTLLMIVVYLIPVLLFLFVYQVIPIVLLFGFSVPAWVAAKMNNKLFKSLEDRILEEQPKEENARTEGEDERIFRDELDETLRDNTPSDH